MFATAFIAKQIKKLGSSLYVYPGGTIAPLLHECKRAGIEFIVPKTEQGAGYMAIADALHQSAPAFVAVTSGPGATNLITCLADAWYDSIPLVVFTGQVGTADLSRSQFLRQRGFQEVPILKMVGPITKRCFQPADGNELGKVVREAISLACDGRPGPVLIDLPMNVQLEKIAPELLDAFEPLLLSSGGPSVSPDGQIFPVQEVFSLLMAAERPVVLVGGGCRGKEALVRELVGRGGIPLLSSIRGIGVLPTDHPLNVGWVGHTGFPWANKTLLDADCVLVLGNRLDIRQTGSELAHFSQKKVIHVDIDEAELGSGRIEPAMKIYADSGEFLRQLIMLELNSLPDWAVWKEAINGYKRVMSLGDHGTAPGVPPDKLLLHVDALTRDKRSAVITGVGSHQQWVMRYLSFDTPDKQLYTSAGHGTMGFALPIALGVKRIDPQRLVIAVDGDGSFQMNIQELSLIKELGLNVKILLMNNSRLGIVSQFQQITFNDDPTTGDFKSPDFCAIASAYGVVARHMENFDEDLVRDWLDEEGASLLHVRVQKDAPVSPMLLGGQALDQMWNAG